MDISLLSGQILKMKVSNVESVTLFHVQLQSASKYEDIVQEYMTDKNTKVSFNINAFDNKSQIAIIFILYVDHKCYKKIKKNNFIKCASYTKN